MFLANDATLAVIGRPAREIIGQRIDLLGGSADEVATINSADARVRETGEVHASEEPWTGPDGVTRIFRSTKGPWRRANGTVGIVAVTVDVSHEREVERKLSESESRFRAVIDGLPFPFWMADADGTMVVHNGLLRDYLGLPAGDAEPARLEDIIDPDVYHQFARYWRQCIELGEMMIAEVGLFDRLEGKYVPHKLTVVPHYRAEGAVAGWVGSAIPV